MRPRPAVRWMHHVSKLLRLAQAPRAVSIHSSAERRQAQRRRLLLELLADADLALPLAEPHFWRVLRWGGAGFLVAQALHYLITG